MPTGALPRLMMVLPVTERPQSRLSASGAGLAHPAIYIACWIVFSNLTILFNKWLIDAAGFPYPISLTCWHMVFAAIATQVLARTTNLLDGRSAVRMTREKYLHAVVPIGIVYSGSLVCSNLPYLYLSVPFIQMLKAAGPVIVLFISWLWGLARPTPAAVLQILVIVLGVVVASAGEIRISWVGLAYQVAGLVFEALRLVMIQVLLSPASPASSPSSWTDEEKQITGHYNDDDNGGGGDNGGKDKDGENYSRARRGGGDDDDDDYNEQQQLHQQDENHDSSSSSSKMDPLVSLYYYAPVCAAMNAVTVYLTEARVFDVADLWRVGPGVLVLNALVAFGLNVASVFLIGKTSSLVMTLCGIFKSILLVATGVLIWGTYISALQLFGYFIALVGLFLYSVPSERISAFAYSLRRR